MNITLQTSKLIFSQLIEKKQNKDQTWPRPYIKVFRVGFGETDSQHPFFLYDNCRVHGPLPITKTFKDLLDSFIKHLSLCASPLTCVLIAKQDKVIPSVNVKNETNTRKMQLI